MLIGFDYQLANLGFVPQVKLGDMIIQRTNSSKSLGVFIDEWLSWAYHIEHLAKKVSSATVGFKASSSVCPTRCIITRPRPKGRAPSLKMQTFFFFSFHLADFALVCLAWVHLSRLAL